MKYVIRVDADKAVAWVDTKSPEYAAAMSVALRLASDCKDEEAGYYLKEFESRYDAAVDKLVLTGDPRAVLAVLGAASAYEVTHAPCEEGSE